MSISISESDDSEERGFPAWQVNRVVLQTVAALFGQGARVVFGHDWREDGVMEAIHGFARQMQPPASLLSTPAEPVAQPPLVNLLPWPDRPTLSDEDLRRLSSTLLVTQVGLPYELQQFEDAALREGPDGLVYRYIRARGLTFLRHQLDKISDVRLCLGGRRTGSEGRYPGIIEEALLALRDNKPLYVAGLLGGAAQQIVDALDRQDMPPDFCIPTGVEVLYRDAPVKETDQTTLEDRRINRDAAWKAFANTDRKEMADRIKLQIDEHDELMHTPVLDRVIELVLNSLSRLQPELPRRALSEE